jgi:hypothetical protein
VENKGKKKLKSSHRCENMIFKSIDPQLTPTEDKQKIAKIYFWVEFKDNFCSHSSLYDTTPL